MAWQNTPVDMAYDDDDILDRMGNYAEAEPPEYPPNLCFSIDENDLKQAAGDDGTVGDCLCFSAMAEVTACHQAADGDRVELCLNEFAGEDGKFFALTTPAYICFCSYELEQMDLEADCEVGDMIHLIGEARLESLHRTQLGEMACLQITALTYEDESTEGRGQAASD